MSTLVVCKSSRLISFIGLTCIGKLSDLNPDLNFGKRRVGGVVYAGSQEFRVSSDSPKASPLIGRSHTAMMLRPPAACVDVNARFRPASRFPATFNVSLVTKFALSLVASGPGR